MQERAKPCSYWFELNDGRIHYISVADAEWAPNLQNSLSSDVSSMLLLPPVEAFCLQLAELPALRNHFEEALQEHLLSDARQLGLRRMQSLERMDGRHCRSLDRCLQNPEPDSDHSGPT